MLWREGTLVAVIDWEDAALGDPVADLAGCRVELTWRYGEPAAQTFTERYLARARIDTADLPRWELYVASAGAAFMDRWGLAPEVERDMRQESARIIDRASRALLSAHSER